MASTRFDEVSAQCGGQDSSSLVVFAVASLSSTWLMGGQPTAPGRRGFCRGSARPCSTRVQQRLGSDKLQPHPTAPCNCLKPLLVLAAGFSSCRGGKIQSVWTAPGLGIDSALAIARHLERSAPQIWELLSAKLPSVNIDRDSCVYFIHLQALWRRAPPVKVKDVLSD